MGESTAFRGEFGHSFLCLSSQFHYPSSSGMKRSMDGRTSLVLTNKWGSDPNLPTHLMREPMRIRAPWVARAAMFLATVG